MERLSRALNLAGRKLLQNLVEKHGVELSVQAERPLKCFKVLLTLEVAVRAIHPQCAVKVFRNWKMISSVKGTEETANYIG